MQRSKRIWCSVVIAITILGVAACADRQSGPEHQSNADQALAADEFGRAVDEGQPAKNIETVDTRDVDVFSNQKLDRPGENHADLPPAPSGQCRVTRGEKLPPEAGGADALCGAIRQAAAAQAPRVAYAVEVEVLSPSMLSARVTLTDGRVLPERRHAVMDRTLTRSSIQRFATAIAAELAKSAPR